MLPTVAGFLLFIRNVMGISALVLPDNSPAISWAFSIATMFVNPDLAVVGSSLNVTPQTNLFVQATYNLAADNLVNYAQDQTGRTYFSDLRASLKINNFAAGVVQSASDNGTSDSLVVPEALQHLTLANLQNLKTPWGRTYLAMAQTAGTLWGVA